MTYHKFLYEKLVGVNISDDIIKIIFDYTKCQYKDCFEFGNTNLITYEKLSEYDGFYCFEHYNSILDNIEYIEEFNLYDDIEYIEEFNLYDDDEFDNEYDGGFMGWDFGVFVDIYKKKKFIYKKILKKIEI